MIDDLFAGLEDEPSEPAAEPAVAQPEVVDRPEWQEVSQAVFLSWSPAMQWAYCAARDEDAALDVTSDEEMEWFLERALRYRQMALEARA